MTTQQKIIKNKSGQLELVQMLSNVSQACKVMGCSDSFYRFKELYDQGGEQPYKRYPAVNLTSKTVSRSISSRLLSK